MGKEKYYHIILINKNNPRLRVFEAIKSKSLEDLIYEVKMENPIDKGFLWVIKDNELFTTLSRSDMKELQEIKKYLENEGWNIPQSEFAIKGNQRIEFDYYPYEYFDGKDRYEWRNLQELKKIL